MEEKPPLAKRMENMETETPSPDAVPRRYVTSPHGRPKCPDHGVRLIVRTSCGEVAYLRCPVDGCGRQDKMTREVLRDEG